MGDGASASSKQQPADIGKKTSGGYLSAGSTWGGDTNNSNKDQTRSSDDLSADTNRDDTSSNSYPAESNDKANSDGDDHGNNMTKNTLSHTQDPLREFPLGYKILLLILALLSVICACICAAGSCLRPEKGKEEHVPGDGVPGDCASDMEDAESKAFMPR